MCLLHGRLASAHTSVRQLAPCHISALKHAISRAPGPLATAQHMQSVLTMLGAAADGKRAAPDNAVAQDAGSLSSQDGFGDDDVAVRLLSPAAEVPIDEEFEADFAALMETHQAHRSPS